MARRTRLGVLAVAASLVCGGHAWAHHALASTFLDKTVTIEGRVVEFLFRNPHSAILVETLDEKPVAWVTEWRTAGELSRQGIEIDALRPGDRVIITGNPSRDSSDHRLRMVSIMRPSDGWKWQGGYP